MKWILILFILTGCLDEIPEQGSSNFCPGIREKDGSCPVSSLGMSSGWDFSKASNYSFDSNYVEINSKSATLKQIDISYDGSSFEAGIHAGTNLENNKLLMKTKPNAEETHVNTVLPNRSSNLLGYWRLENNLLDSGTFGRNGNTLTATANFNDESKVGNYSADFSSGGLGIQIDNVIDVNGKQPFSVSAWAKVENSTFTGAGNLFSWYFEDGGGRHQIFCFTGVWSSENRFRCEFVEPSQGFPGVWTTGRSLNTYHWYHIVLTFDGSSAKLFLDGELMDTLVLGPTITSLPQTLTLGSRGDGGSRFYGKIDDVSVWNVALNDLDVFKLFSKQNQSYSSLSSDWTPHWEGIEAYWKFDGNWLDSSGNGNHGEDRAGVGFSVNPKVGTQAALFDGVDDDVQLTSLDITNWTEISLCGWYRTTTNGLYRRMVSILHSGVDDVRIFMTSGKLWFSLDDGTQFDITDSTKTNDGDWHHFCGVFDGVSSKLYRDSKLVGTLPASFNFSTANGLLRVGEAAMGGTEFSGVLDDISLFKKGLSGSDVKLIYNRQKQKFAASYESPVIDLGSSQTLTNISTTNDLPYLKELASTDENLSDYSQLSGNLNNGLFGYWPLNELTGAITKNYSEQGSTLDGNLLNSVDIGEDGILNKAFHFSSNARVVVDSSNMLFSSYTACHWIKSDGVADRSIVSQTFNNGKSGNFSFNWDHNNSTNDLRGTFQHHDGTGWNFARVSTDLKSRTWYHICGSWDGSNLKVYVNGQLEDNVPNITGVDERNGNFYIGSGLNSGTFEGSVDEMAVWNRALTDEEIQQFYRRGATRIKYQIRNCVDSSCSNDPEWKGPGGDGTTYFSELYNQSSSHLLDMFSSCDASGDNLCSDGEFSFKESPKATSFELKFVDSLINNYSQLSTRYFQYRVAMEAEDNSACEGKTCLPSLNSISFETKNSYYTNTPSVSSKKGIQINSRIIKVEEEVEGDCKVKYQFSKDGTHYYFLKNGKWVSATNSRSEANTVSEINPKIKYFISSGVLYFRAYLISNGSQSCNLKRISVSI